MIIQTQQKSIPGLVRISKYKNAMIIFQFATNKKTFILSAVGVVFVLFLSQMDGIVEAFRAEDLLQNGFSAEIILAGLSSDWMTLALPILAALPCTAAFVDEVKSGFVKEYLPRTTVRKYIGGKIAACTLSGGFVLAAGILLAYGISVLVFAPMEAPLEEGMTARHYLAEMISHAALFFLSGAFWALIGMTFSALTNSRYMAYASPFIFYYILIILNERYFPDLYILYPKEWLIPSEFWVLGSLGVVIWLMELGIIMALVFIYAAKRRINKL